jgi:hypothetical protein
VPPLAVPPLAVPPLAVPPLAVPPLAVPPLAVPLAVPPLTVPPLVNVAVNEHALPCDPHVPESVVPDTAPLHARLVVSVPLKLTLSPTTVPVASPPAQLSEMVQPLCVMLHASEVHPLTDQDPVTSTQPPPFDAEQASPEATDVRTAPPTSAPRTARQMASRVGRRS